MVFVSTVVNDAAVRADRHRERPDLVGDLRGGEHGRRGERVDLIGQLRDERLELLEPVRAHRGSHAPPLAHQPVLLGDHDQPHGVDVGAHLGGEGLDAVGLGHR